MDTSRVALDTFLATDLLDALPFGTVLIGSGGELLHLNSSAHELLDMGALDGAPRGVHITDGHGRPMSPGDSPLARLRAGECLNGLRMRLVRDDGVRRDLVYYGHALARPGHTLLTAHETPDARAAGESCTGTGNDALAYVCHDLRAPIRALAGFSQILREDHAKALPDEARSLLDRIEQSALKVGGMLEDIQRLTCISAGACRRGPVDLAQVARDHLAVIAPTRRVELRMPATLPAWGDEGLLRLALGNLLNNALKFSPDGNPVVVELGRQHPYGAFFVRDEGIGFDPEQADALFRPFVRLANAHGFEGTGLGLAITRQVIERHGGRLWAEATPGMGATFYFTLPERAHPRGTRLP
ncbi:MAG: ATP-binding protein [Thiohalomonadaceae bacterium]